VTSIAFLQGSTADPEQRPGVPHCAFKPLTKQGREFLDYEPRRSLEFRLLVLYDLPAEIPLPDGWTMHFDEDGRRYYLHNEQGSTWKHPGLFHSHDALFFHLKHDPVLHPPTHPRPAV
jgi:hypothetical protein